MSIPEQVHKMHASCLIIVIPHLEMLSKEHLVSSKNNPQLLLIEQNFITLWTLYCLDVLGGPNTST